MRYIGFGGTGYQVRDAFHPRDLAGLLHAQIVTGRNGGRRIYTVGGGPENAMSLAQLTAWCNSRFGKHQPQADDRPRKYDVPWIVMDSTHATKEFEWRRSVDLITILEEISCHAQRNPRWLEVSGL